MYALAAVITHYELLGLRALNARLIELAWYDGARTGAAVGVLVGIVIGVALAVLLRR